MKCGRQPVVVPIAQRNGGTLLGGEGKKVLDLKRRQICRELSQTEKWKLPVLHSAPLMERIVFACRNVQGSKRQGKDQNRRKGLILLGNVRL